MLKILALFKPIQLLLVGCFLILLLLILPGVALAAPPAPAGAEPCAECHEPETTAWQDSSHAKAGNSENGAVGATCEDCHGTYVEGHPGEGVMRLAIDSSGCEDCHADTFTQWQNTVHAQAGVQCIGCHLSHSQEFRLTDEALCGSCHRERLDDFSHTAHGLAHVACTDCHASSASGGDLELASISVSQSMMAPDHDFTHVSSEDCIRCHGQDAHTLLPAHDQIADAQVVALAESVPDLTARLEAVEESNKTLQIMAPVSLGIGLGIGAVLGIAFMVVVGYISQRRDK
jgi:hypothetical protein